MRVKKRPSIRPYFSFGESLDMAYAPGIPIIKENIAVSVATLRLFKSRLAKSASKRTPPGAFSSSTLSHHFGRVLSQEVPVKSRSLSSAK